MNEKELKKFSNAGLHAMNYRLIRDNKGFNINDESCDDYFVVLQRLIVNELKLRKKEAK